MRRLQGVKDIKWNDRTMSYEEVSLFPIELTVKGEPSPPVFLPKSTFQKQEPPSYKGSSTKRGCGNKNKRKK